MHIVVLTAVLYKRCRVLYVMHRVSRGESPSVPVGPQHRRLGLEFPREDGTSHDAGTVAMVRRWKGRSLATRSHHLEERPTVSEQPARRVARAGKGTCYCSELGTAAVTPISLRPHGTCLEAADSVVGHESYVPQLFWGRKLCRHEESAQPGDTP